MEKSANIENFIAIITDAIARKQIISFTTKQYENDILVRLRIKNKSYRRIVNKDEFKSFIFLMGNRAFVTQVKEATGINVEDNTAE